ncbi:PREDICTED: carboxylesterase 1E [Rhagoletis zephyria]|uniref:carboxylesterase 1E n=1 Tax=Rhagoletis zephyria TaxID=28612 RepID=UPI0008118CD1|nr:PREDICTED: carboxylesterase 1E [Rhagoletis zephyria]
MQLFIFAIFACALLRCDASSPNHTRVKRIVGGRQSKAPPPDDPVVFTRTFNRDARVEGFRNERTGIYSFLGMYYAEPPIGLLRYARPVYKRMAGDINATSHGPPCIQPDPYDPRRLVGEENCLLLNVYTPRMPDENTGLPVYVWIHPGGFRYGSAAQYDATPIAQQGVIVVAPQYRLGSLGIMGDGTKEFDGNLAIFDMAAALRWVNDYIHHFGGDPKQVKAIGHGSGAASAMYLSMSRSARAAGDVSGVVAMSGTALSQYATDKEPVQSVEEVATINGCPTTNELAIVQCLREKSAEEIIQNDSKVQTERLAGRALVKGLSGNVGFTPHIEGENDGRALPSLIVGEPEQQLRNGNFTPIPLLTGVTKHETANAVSLDTLNKIFGSAQQFLNSLTDALKDLTGFLRIDSLTGEIAKPVLPGLTSALTPTLNDLLKVPETLNLDQVLSKVIESTTDILFNLPAVLSTQVWSQLAPSFMYSFEYNGTRSKGINFLRGLPIVAETAANNNTEVVAHGDELGYMFDANDLFGNPIPEAQLSDAEDLKVRQNLIGMLVKFAKSFGGEDGKASTEDSLFQSVTGKGVPFIKVDTELSAGSDFRFCELSVLGASLTPLTSTTCKSLGGLLSPLTDVVGGTLGNTLGGVGGVLGGGGGGGGSGERNIGGGAVSGVGNTLGGVLGGGANRGVRPGAGRGQDGRFTSRETGGLLGAGGLLG